MIIKYYPDEKTVVDAMQVDDPLLMLVAYDGSEILLANIDDAFEHSILLHKMHHWESDIDRYYRLVVSHEGADWTFVCPSNYKGITDRVRRIETFYNDGIPLINEALKIIHYNDAKIEIPKRYRRHFRVLGGES